MEHVEHGLRQALRTFAVAVAVIVGLASIGLAVLAAARSLASGVEALGALSLLLAGQSGWGKSFKAQHVMEQNIERYDHVLVLDYCDEYRGLVKAGLADWWIGGPRELSWSAEDWREAVNTSQRLVVARYDRLTKDQWQELCAAAIQGSRRLGDVLIVVDEAHFVAPQSGKVPTPIEGLATTGRGEGASGLWVTQRPAKLEEDVVGLCQAKLLGGFDSDADFNKLDGLTEYPVDLHNPQKRTIPNVPDELQPENRETPVSLQMHENDAGQTTGSEWIYSDNSGERRRETTRGLVDEMQTTHYGSEGKDIKV
jgi:hypothetical protein